MKYTTTAIVELTGGILELSKDQARRRLSNLVKLKDGRFEILRAVQFKAGETFGYDGDIPKSMANSLSEFGSNLPIAEKQAKDAAAAKKKKLKDPSDPGEPTDQTGPITLNPTVKEENVKDKAQ